MKKSWGMIPKILSGEKTIESRWYETRRAPWGKIETGEIVYFKNSGEPITARAKVSKVMKLDRLNSKRIEEILEKFGKNDGIPPEKISYFAKLFKDKKYCLLIFLSGARQVRPFWVSKAGFGQMTSWLILPSRQLFRFS